MPTSVYHECSMWNIGKRIITDRVLGMTTQETYQHEVPQYEQDARIVKQVLTHLIGEIQTAEGHADDTKWAEEKAEILSGALSSVGRVLDHLAYEMRREHLNALKYDEHSAARVPDCREGGG